MAITAVIHGFRVTHEENAREGLAYLRDDLDASESRVFFDQAKLKGSAQFEDDNERQFTLIYQNGAYVLVRR